MPDTIQIEPDGTLTLPQAVREKTGLKEGDQLAVEITADGILLKPLSGSPIEIYTEARAAEFKAADDELRGYRFK
ncbi:MAG: AbrB/MazE/SpoVT family DNA-binding domain-containing protein [Verrucomicrobia bacterium]|nr:AbrB/MazE/SpoVT family DNA-binding domain-containing protein [Verrucomicrobiota bacterium]